jgi:hypothetical protein
MVQLYFLSIVFNGLAGFLFVFAELSGGDSAENSAKISSVSSGFRLIIGILAAITGILKLLLPMGEAGKVGLPLLGDLLPALASLIAGFMLIFGFYRERTSHVDSEEKINRFGEVALHYKKAVGIALLAVALLHFLFPSALFL